MLIRLLLRTASKYRFMIEIITVDSSFIIVLEEENLSLYDLHYLYDVHFIVRELQFYYCHSSRIIHFRSHFTYYMILIFMNVASINRYTLLLRVSLSPRYPAHYVSGGVLFLCNELVILHITTPFDH